MKSHYQTTQFSLPLTVIFGLLLIYSTMVMIASQFSALPVLVFVLLVVCLVTFTTLTLDITEERLDVRFGPGLLHKAYPLVDICDVRIVNLAQYNAFRQVWNVPGWLYNFKTLDAVELEMRNGSLLWIGSDQARQLAKSIENAMIERS